MKKFLSIVLLLVCVVILSVVVSSYVMKYRINRYQLIFGEVLYEKTMDLPDQKGYVKKVVSEKKPVCFKLDTLTGDTWIYTDSFHDGDKVMSTVDGFLSVAEGYGAYTDTYKKAKKVFEIPLEAREPFITPLADREPEPNDIPQKQFIPAPDELQPGYKKTP